MGSGTPVTAPSKPAQRMRRTGQCLMLVIGRSSLEPPHYHGAVGAAKAEGIRQGDIDLHFARFIGAVVQIALRILIRSEAHTSELPSLMRLASVVSFLK